MKQLPAFMERDGLDFIVKLDPSHSYGDACNYGKAAAFEFIRFNIQEGGFSGGLLQHIALCQFSEEEYSTGFAVGFFAQIEEMLTQSIGKAYNTKGLANTIVKDGLNNPEISPLSFRGGEA